VLRLAIIGVDRFVTLAANTQFPHYPQSRNTSLNGPMLIPVPISVYQRDSLQQVPFITNVSQATAPSLTHGLGRNCPCSRQLTEDRLTLTAAS